MSALDHRAAIQEHLLVAGNHDSGESGGGRIDNYIKHCGQPFAKAVKGNYGKQYTSTIHSTRLSPASS